MNRSSPPPGTPKWLAALRDLLLLFGGLAGIAYQTVTGKVDIALLVTFVVMTGMPGVTRLVEVLRGGIPTGPPSLPPASQESPSESSN